MAGCTWGSRAGSDSLIFSSPRKLFTANVCCALDHPTQLFQPIHVSLSLSLSFSLSLSLSLPSSSFPPSLQDYAYPADELMPLSCKGRVRGIDRSRGSVDEALGWQVVCSVCWTVDSVHLELATFIVLIHCAVCGCTPVCYAPST